MMFTAGGHLTTFIFVGIPSPPPLIAFFSFSSFLLFEIEKIQKNHGIGNI